MSAQSSGNIITSPQTITGSWADVKDSGTSGEIDALGRSFFCSYIELDINDSLNVQFRFKALDVKGGNEYFIPFRTLKPNKTLLDGFPFEINNDADQNIIITTPTNNAIPIIKLQVQALTVGGTAGIITTATYRQGYVQ